MEKRDLGEKLREEPEELRIVDEIENLHIKRRGMETHEQRSDLDTRIATLVNQYEETTGKPYVASEYQP
ncbi:hypothetical protein HOE04_02760 [archaeon]|jgi:hypothetical protein|nr:hypothetical protein [archaeon]